MTTAKAPRPSATARVATIPNVLSLLRLASVPIFVWLFVTGRETVAVVLYAIGASSDFLDGFIARRFAQVSELGKVLDPLADRVLILALAVALVARRALPLWLALAVIARDVLVLSLFPALERRGVARIPVNTIGKAATAALLVGLTCLAFAESSFSWARGGDEIGLPLVALGAALYWAAALAYAREARTRLRALARPTDPASRSGRPGERRDQQVGSGAADAGPVD